MYEKILILYRGDQFNLFSLALGQGHPKSRSFSTERHSCSVSYQLMDGLRY